MKKLMILLALAALLLAGCGTRNAAETTPETPDVREQSQDVGVGEAVVPEEGDITIEIN